MVRLVDGKSSIGVKDSLAGQALSVGGLLLKLNLRLASLDNCGRSGVGESQRVDDRIGRNRFLLREEVGVENVGAFALVAADLFAGSFINARSVDGCKPHPKRFVVDQHNLSLLAVLRNHGHHDRGCPGASLLIGKALALTVSINSERIATAAQNDPDLAVWGLERVKGIIVERDGDDVQRNEFFRQVVAPS